MCSTAAWHAHEPSPCCCLKTNTRKLSIIIILVVVILGRLLSSAFTVTQTKPCPKTKPMALA